MIYLDKKVGKYGNHRTEFNGVMFDSKREAERWEDLTLLQRAGKISQLERQVPYQLVPAVRLGNAQRMKPAIKLIVDFRYVDHLGNTVLEDTKTPGTITQVFRIKQHLLKHVHGLEVKLK